MPIGAQLPIKQAERIEIIFGPGASIYGADASAGVINIITSQTERPIYAQADLGLGSNQYNHLSVMFGGKVGKGKRILKFSVSGSTTEFDTRNIEHDQVNLYNPFLYRQDLSDTSYLNNPNYLGTIDRNIINDLPHLSKSLSVHLKYRAFNLSFSKMYRRDHSALGLNPLAVSYADPSTFTGETINTFNIGFSKKKPKWGMNTNINYIGYKMDNNSSTIYVDNSLSKVLKFYVNSIFSSFPDLRDTINNQNFDTYFSGRRYQYASSNDIRLEQLVNIRPIKNLEVILGANLALNFYQPQINYRNTPNTSTQLITTDTSILIVGGGPIFVENNLSGSVGLFTQLYLTLKKLNIIAGVRFDSFSNFGRTVNPRIGMLYKISPSLSAYGSLATAFRAPSPFYGANTYLVESTNFTDFMTNPLPILPEKTESADFGLRFRVHKKVKLDFNFFVSRTNNIISPFSSFDFSNPQQIRALVGYTNDDASESLLYGTQINFILSDLWMERDLKIRGSFNFSRGREVLPFEGGRLESVRMQPLYSGQINTSFRLTKRFYIHLNGLFADAWNNRNYIDEADRQFTSSGYFNLDVMGRLQLTSSFNAFLKIGNFFNTYYGGIGATGTLDDLAYNPQRARTVWLGMSYRMQ
jgi:outer membrane receptor protein involved in Fe transport